jgi:hypothetical protein
VVQIEGQLACSISVQFVAAARHGPHIRERLDCREVLQPLLDVLDTSNASAFSYY